jgi:hypothetical protein
MMRANRVRALHQLSDGSRFWWRGRGQLGRWLLKHGLLGHDGRVTERGREECRKALEEYNARGRLTQVFAAPRN